MTGSPDPATSPWPADELDELGDAEELRIAPVRRDGTLLSRFRRIWVVRVGDGLYVRSAYGPDSGWYRRARRSGHARIRTAELEMDVALEHVPARDGDLHAAIDAAYHEKYDKYGPRVVGTVVGAEAAGLSLRIFPARPA